MLLPRIVVSSWGLMMERVSAFTDLCTPEGLFRYGSKIGGVPPTPVRAEWLNLVQEELCNFIRGYLPALDADDNSQMLKAAQKMVANLALKATTLAGYGIIDAYTKAQTDGMLAEKANWAITLGGYGIGDAYTKNEVNQLLSQKVPIANTLAGYGIIDAYTISQIDFLLATLRSQVDAELALKQLKNTASFGSAASWVRDGSTGAMEQYGVFGMSSGPNEQTITFPIAFPTACRAVVLTNMEDSAPEGNIARVLRWDNYGVTFVNSGGNTFTSYAWVAKGN